MYFQVVIGDHDGTIQLFTMKRGEVQFGFQTQAAKSITRLELGGALGNNFFHQILTSLFIIPTGTQICECEFYHYSKPSPFALIWAAVGTQTVECTNGVHNNLWRKMHVGGHDPQFPYQLTKQIFDIK